MKNNALIMRHLKWQVVQEKMVLGISTIVLSMLVYGGVLGWNPSLCSNIELQTHLSSKCVFQAQSLKQKGAKRISRVLRSALPLEIRECRIINVG